MSSTYGSPAAELVPVVNGVLSRRGGVTPYNMLTPLGPAVITGSVVIKLYSPQADDGRWWSNPRIPYYSRSPVFILPIERNFQSTWTGLVFQ